MYQQKQFYHMRGLVLGLELLLLFKAKQVQQAENLISDV